MFKHFILTRFNIMLNNIHGYDKSNHPIQTEEWLERRFILFEEFCLPSIMNQSCKDFIWFVLFSSNTPDKFIQKIKNIELRFPLFKPLFLSRGDNKSIKNALCEELHKYLGIFEEYIITSRIDNDDVFHKDMVIEVQKQFNRQVDVFVSCTYGLQYDIERKILAHLHYKNNHFISRIEKVANGIETVITLDHTFIDRIAEVICIGKKHKPMWIEIIHGGNLYNSLDHLSVPLFIYKTTGSFSIIAKISLSNTLFVFIKYLRLQALLLRANILQRIGIYDFLRGLFKNNDLK